MFERSLNIVKDIVQRIGAGRWTANACYFDRRLFSFAIWKPYQNYGSTFEICWEARFLFLKCFNNMDLSDRHFHFQNFLLFRFLIVLTFLPLWLSEVLWTILKLTRHHKFYHTSLSHFLLDYFKNWFENLMICYCVLHRSKELQNWGGIFEFLCGRYQCAAYYAFSIWLFWEGMRHFGSQVSEFENRLWVSGDCLSRQSIC